MPGLVPGIATAVDYDGLIPNNVGLNADPRLRKARWRPGTRVSRLVEGSGPDGFQAAPPSICAPPSASISEGWAKFGFVRMPEYRWGILLAPQVEGRTIPFGAHKGEPAWQEVPGEYRAMLRRLLVIQGDTEPASVEQQRHLGATAPSLYDLRNLFQVNVEEGRHLWAMVYLLQKYFGRDGREEAEELRRRSGDRDSPRMLGAFNERTPDWLSFFMFTFFTDRDGKMQLHALAQSGFDPLSRTCRFMLTEEAHHMFVGETGVAASSRHLRGDEQGRHRRSVRCRTGARAWRHRSADVAEEGQSAFLADARSVRQRNQHQRRQRVQRRAEGPLPGRPADRRPCADRRDLSGAAAARRRDRARGRAGAVGAEHAAARRLRRRCDRRGVERWNRVIAQPGSISASPCRMSRSTAGSASSPRSRPTPEGNLLTAADWAAARRVPALGRGRRVCRLTDAPVREPGAFASWIAPPVKLA
jgi:benzoyl-CoA 2,3-dioxygenase component B